MSADTQTTFLARLREMGEKADLDVRIDNDWANTGAVAFSYRTELDPILVVKFAFNSGPRTAQFTLTGGPLTSDEKLYAKYDSPDLDNALDRIWSAIKPEEMSS